MLLKNKTKLLLSAAFALSSTFISPLSAATSKKDTQMTQNSTLPSWDLTDLFTSYNGPELKQHLTQLESEIANFAKLYTGKVATLSAEDLATAIKSYESISDNMGRLSGYAYLIYSQDRTNTDIGAFYQNTHELLTKLSSDLVFFTLDLNNLENSELETKYSQSDALLHYKSWIDQSRQFKPHQLSNEMEQLMQDKAVTASSAWVRLYDELLADMRFDLGGKQAPISDVLNQLGHKESAKRKSAAMALSKGLKGSERTFAMILNTLSYNLSTDNKWRKFKSIDSAQHLNNQIDDEVVEALTTAVKSSYTKLSHRYYNIKAKRFGQQKLKYWDRNAPYPDAKETKVDWTKAKDIVLKAYQDFSPEMADIANTFFEKKWIDADLRPGKDSGAYSHPIVPSTHPYILMNYHGKPRCVTTLAHELGHGIHQVLAREQGALMADTPLTLAETASVFGEMLTFQSLLKETEKSQRKYLIASKIEDMLNTVVRQIAFYQFEKSVHTARQQGELSSADISKIWMQVQADSLGSAIELDETYEIYWAYVSHFYHVPFYVYAYAFGDCLVNSLYAYYQDNPNGFQEKYIALLKAGGTKRYDEALKPFGFNLKDPAFWEKGLSMIERLIDDFENEG